MANVNLFKNKTVLITGGGEGLGRALAIELALNKTDVIIVDRKKELLNGVIEEVAKSKKKVGRVLGVLGDISTLKGVEEVIKNVKKVTGSFDMLINNAAAMVPGKFDDQSIATIQSIIDTNVSGTIALTRLALPILRANKKPGIINICGFYGKVGVPYFSVYSASQFAIAGFTEALQRAYAGENIRVMGVYPAGLKSNLFKGMVTKLSKLNFVFDETTVVAKKIIESYNDLKNNLMLGKKEKSLAFWNTVNKESVSNKFKKIKTRLLNITANYGNDE